jgi:hypothetical protein
LPHLWQLTVSLSGWSLGKFVILELHPHTRSTKALIQLATLRAGMARESLAKAYYELDSTALRLVMHGLSEEALMISFNYCRPP